MDRRAGRKVSPDRPAQSRSALTDLRQSVSAFIADDVLTHSAALAFYTLLSFAPLIVLALVVASLMGPDAQKTLLDQIGAVVGLAARDAAGAVLESSTSRPDLGSVAGLAGLATLIVGATTVFAQLQSSLNLIFGVVAEPTNAAWGWLRRRFLSFGVIFAIGFVLIASLIVSAVLGYFLGEEGGVLFDIANQAVTAAVLSVLFGILFRYLPDARIPWRWAFLGGLSTAVLFAIGKWAIAFYLARGDVGGAYGAAGSLAVLLVWVYYAAAIFFYGAELTKVWLKRQGLDIEPLAHARRVA